MSAMTTPWSVRKSLKFGSPLACDSDARHGPPAARGRVSERQKAPARAPHLLRRPHPSGDRGGEAVRPASTPWNPEPAAALRRPRALRLGRLLGALRDGLALPGAL